MKNMLAVSATAVLFLAACGPEGDFSTESIGQSQDAVTGSSSGSGTGPNMSQRGRNYFQTMTVSPIPPPTATITTVQYSWSTSYKPTGLKVSLCWDTTANCVALTANSGTTSAFSGKSASKNLFYQFGTSGKGTLSPTVVGKTNTVLVSYTY